MTGRVAWVDVARLRQGVYRFFAAALLPPDQDRLGRLHEAAGLLCTMGVERFAFAPSWFAFVDQMNEGHDAGKVMSEYLRLFEVGVDGALCPPIESYYVTSARSGGAASVQARIRRELAELGISPAGGGLVSPDHAVSELEVMAALCDRERGAAELDDPAEVARVIRIERLMLERHLGMWFNTFADRVGRSARLVFYRRLVDAAAAFVQHDRQFLAALADPAVAEPV